MIKRGSGDLEVTPTEDFGLVEFGARFSVQVYHFHGRVRLQMVIHNLQDGTHDIQTLYSYPVTNEGEEANFRYYDKEERSTEIDLEELLRFLHELPSTNNSLLSFLGIICRSEVARDLVCMIEKAICACQLWWGWGCPMAAETLQCYNEAATQPSEYIRSHKQRDQWVYAKKILATRAASKEAEKRQ
jgi:hypothetical protein